MLGCLIGGAAGDACGSTQEFSHPQPVAFPALALGPQQDIVGGGPFRLEPGQITDDTMMGAALASSLRENKGWVPKDVISRYAHWRTVTFDIGGQTGSGISAFNAGKDPLKCGLSAWTSSRSRAGNGGLMRVAPVAVAFYKDPAKRMQAAIEDALLTHADPRCLLANVVFCEAIADAIKWGGNPRDMMKAARAGLRDAMPHLRKISEFTEAEILSAHQDIKQDLDMAEQDDPCLYTGPVQLGGGSAGFVRTALRLAFWHLMHTASFRAAILDTTNRGHDSDTNAKIVGDLLGARFGIDKIPPLWVSKVLDALQLAQPPSALRDAYHPKQFISLVDQLCPGEPPRVLRDDKMRPWTPIPPYAGPSKPKGFGEKSKTALAALVSKLGIEQDEMELLDDGLTIEEIEALDNRSPGAHVVSQEGNMSLQFVNGNGNPGRIATPKVRAESLLPAELRPSGGQLALPMGPATGGSFASYSPTRTSVTHPLRVDRMPRWITDTKGSMGLTLCPGRNANGHLRGHERDLDADLERIQKTYRIDIIVSLMEEHEYREQKVEALWAKCKDLGIQTVWFPIKDLNTPTDAEAVRTLCVSIIKALRAGRNILLHCKGGLGRSGTIASCVLRTLGYTGKWAIAACRKYRPNAIDTGKQEQFILDFKPAAGFEQVAAKVERRCWAEPDFVASLMDIEDRAAKGFWGATSSRFTSGAFADSSDGYVSRKEQKRRDKAARRAGAEEIRTEASDVPPVEEVPDWWKRQVTGTAEDEDLPWYVD